MGWTRVNRVLLLTLVEHSQSFNFYFNLLFLQVLQKWNRILPKVVHHFHPISKPSSSKSSGQNFQKKWKHHQPSKGTHCLTLTPHGSNISHNWISLESVAGRTSQIMLNFDLKKMMLFVSAFILLICLFPNILTICPLFNVWQGDLKKPPGL